MNCQVITELHVSTLKKSFIVLFASLLAMAPAANAQRTVNPFNPEVQLYLKHPPGLDLSIEKIVFGPAEGECSNEIIQAVTSDFVDNGIDVIDRQNLDLILNEHDLTAAGLANPKNAFKIGEILGPTALLIIRVSRCATDQQRLRSTVERYNRETKKNVKIPVYLARTTVFLSLSIQTIDVTTGRVFAAKTLKYEPKKINQSSEGYPEYPARFEVLDSAIGGAVRDIRRMFFPWTETLTRTFFNSDGKHCNLKPAYQAYSATNTQRAFDLSLQNIEICKSNPKVGKKILANAYYNAALLYRVRNDLENALKNYQTAGEITPNRPVISMGIQDCREAIKARDDMKRIEQQSEEDLRKLAKALEEQADAQKAEEEKKKQETMTNDDVIKLSKLPEKIVIARIESAENCNFDISSEALNHLSEAGVGDNVIVAVIEKDCAQ